MVVENKIAEASPVTAQNPRGKSHRHSPAKDGIFGGAGRGFFFNLTEKWEK